MRKAHHRFLLWLEMGARRVIPIGTAISSGWKIPKNTKNPIIALTILISSRPRNAPYQRRSALVAGTASDYVRMSGGFAGWFPVVWGPFVELREIIIYLIPASPGACEDM